MTILRDVDELALQMPKETLKVWLALQRLKPSNSAEIAVNQDELAEAAGTSDRQVRRALSQLEEKGFLMRISRPPRPTRIVIHASIRRDVSRTPEILANEPPEEVVEQAAQAVYRFWRECWVEKFKIQPHFDQEEMEAARRLVLLHWQDGMEHVKSVIRSAFVTHMAPILSRI